MVLCDYCVRFCAYIQARQYYDSDFKRRHRSSSQAAATINIKLKDQEWSQPFFYRALFCDYGSPWRPCFCPSKLYLSQRPLLHLHRLSPLHDHAHHEVCLFHDPYFLQKDEPPVLFYQKMHVSGASSLSEQAGNIGRGKRSSPVYQRNWVITYISFQHKSPSFDLFISPT